MHYFGVATQTSTTAGVTRLASADFMIEMEVVAVINSMVGSAHKAELLLHVLHGGAEIRLSKWSVLHEPYYPVFSVDGDLSGSANID
jgi:hypothetical protein